MATLFGLFPFLKKLFADGGYQGPQFRDALAKVLPELKIEIVKRSDQAAGFEVCPNAGSSSEHSLGWAVVEGLPKTSKIVPEPR